MTSRHANRFVLLVGTGRLINCLNHMFILCLSLVNCAASTMAEGLDV